MRKLIYAALVAAPSLTAKIPANRWIQAGAMDVSIARPFAVYRIVDAPATVVDSAQPRLQIWVHDDRGSYTQIDDILALLRSVLVAATPLENATDRIVDIEWTGDSPDLVDDGFNTNTRFTSFTLTGRK